MSSDSALRRMRVARWSRRNSSSSEVGSASFSSISVMYSSCLVTRFWLRRPRLTNASARLRRRAAWLACQLDGGLVQRLESIGHAGHLFDVARL